MGPHTTERRTYMKQFRTGNPQHFLEAFVALCFFGVQVAVAAAGFTPLEQIAGPKFLNSPPGYPGGRLDATNLIDGNLKTEFASADLGTNTVVEFGFAQPGLVAAIRHVDRNDPATVAESEFEFFDATGTRTAAYPVTHVNRRHGETFFILPKPALAQRVKWRVTKLGVPTLQAPGGSEMSFWTAGEQEVAPIRSQPTVRVLPFLDRAGNQLLKVRIEHPYTQPADVTLRVGTMDLGRAQLPPGGTELELRLAHVDAAATRALEVQYEGRTVVSAAFEQKPIRPLTVYVVPHSHTDIGYTEIQTAIETKQVQNLVDGLAAARRTAEYPEGSRFVWNVEVGWAADLYLQRLDAQQRSDFLAGVRKGQIVLNGMYLNELTGL